MRETTMWTILGSIVLLGIVIGGLQQCSYEHKERLKSLEVCQKARCP